MPMISDQPFVSVVIPTYNRCELVRRTLESLAQQTYPSSRFEVILCDDGSTDGTGEMAQSLQVPYQLRYFWQANRGRAAARNLGLRQAQGEIILFLDGDMVADPSLIAEHVASHQIYPDVLVRGDIRLPPEIRETNLFTVLALGPLDDLADQIADEDGFLPFTLALTGNLSLTREILGKTGPQDESFDASYAWDDVDLGYRAHCLGYRLFFNRRALAWHYDYVRTLDQQCKRLRILSRSVHFLFQKYPELEGTIAMFRDKGDIAWGRDAPQVLFKKIAWRLVSRTPVRNGLLGIIKVLERIGRPRRLLGFLYHLILGSDIFLGYQAGLAERNRSERVVQHSASITIQQKVR